SYSGGGHRVSSRDPLPLRDPSLLTPEPYAECSPHQGERHDDHGETREAHPEAAEQPFGPCPRYVASTVDERVDEGLRLVLVLPGHDGEQRLARRSHDRSLYRPERRLEDDERR